MNTNDLLKGKLLMYLLLVLPCVQAQHSLKRELDSLLQSKQARVGIAVKFDGKEFFVLNDQYHYPLMSVFKFHQALAVLDYLDQHQIPLAEEILIRKTDLLPDTYSPLRDERPEGNFRMSIADLLKYSVSQSDNNACDILFRYIGGTKVVDKYIRSLGINDFKIVATEEKLNKVFENQYLNWTTPSAVVRLMEKFHKEALFKNPVYKKFLEKIMIATITGKDKLQAGLPQGVILGHKTGSSGRSEAGLKVGDNDIGFVCLPDGRRYAIAVFVMDSKENDKTNAATIAEISKRVYKYYTSGKE